MAHLDHVPVRNYYHYCSLEAFAGIVGSRKIWLSARNASNDPKEIQFAQQEIMTALKRVRHEVYQGYRGFFVSLMAGRIVSLLNSHDIYTASLTSKKDDLPLWREYTNAGNGLAFGFRPRSLTDMHCRIHKVTYLEESSDEVFHLISEFIKPYEYMIDIEENGDVISDKKVLVTEISVKLLASLFSIKSSAWQYEDELRLSFASSKQANDFEVTELPNGVPVLWRAPKQRDTKNGKVSYYDLEFGKFIADKYDPSGAFSDIVIGPNANFSVNEVKKLLRGNGFDVPPITKSAAAFR
jgi:Protein of unknown function (DUF2971)